MNLKIIDGEDPIVGEGVGFERLRRITGYLVGTLDRFNDGKRAEEHDRVKHSVEMLAQDEKIGGDGGPIELNAVKPVERRYVYIA